LIFYFRKIRKEVKWLSKVKLFNCKGKLIYFLIDNDNDNDIDNDNKIKRNFFGLF